MIDVLEDEHIKIMQISCLVFNFLGIAAKLNDPESKVVLFLTIKNVRYNLCY